MSKINKKQLEGAEQDLIMKIREGQWLEELKGKGMSAEDVENNAREALGITENDSIIEKAQEILPKMNLAKFSLIKLNSLTQDLSSVNLLSQEEEILLNSIEKRLAEKVGNFFGLDNVYEDHEGGNND